MWHYSNKRAYQKESPNERDICVMNQPKKGENKRKRLKSRDKIIVDILNVSKWAVKIPKQTF